MMTARPRAANMYSHHRVEILGGHVPDGSVTNNPGIVHQDVEAAPRSNGLLNQVTRLLVVAHVPIVRQRRTTPLLDECDGLIGISSGATPVHIRTEIVDDD